MPFKKGEEWNGNRNGRPKGSGLNLTTLLKEKLEEVPDGGKEAYKHIFIRKLLDKGLVQDDLNALKLIINYIDGLPQQNVDHTSLGERVIPILNGVFDNNSDKEDSETEEEN